MTSPSSTPIASSASQLHQRRLLLVFGLTSLYLVAEVVGRLITKSLALLADAALMTDDISKIADARAIARRAYRTIEQNLFVGVGVVHVLGIVAALLKLIGRIEAAIIHPGPDILVFLNSVRLLRMRFDESGTTPTARGSR